MTRDQTSTIDQATEECDAKPGSVYELRETGEGADRIRALLTHLFGETKLAYSTSHGYMTVVASSDIHIDMTSDWRLLMGPSVARISSEVDRWLRAHGTTPPNENAKYSARAFRVGEKMVLRIRH